MGLSRNVNVPGGGSGGGNGRGRSGGGANTAANLDKMRASLSSNNRPGGAPPPIDYAAAGMSPRMANLNQVADHYAQNGNHEAAKHVAEKIRVIQQQNQQG